MSARPADVARTIRRKAARASSFDSRRMVATRVVDRSALIESLRCCGPMIAPDASPHKNKERTVHRIVRFGG